MTSLQPGNYSISWTFFTHNFFGAPTLNQSDTTFHRVEALPAGVTTPPRWTLTPAPSGTPDQLFYLTLEGGFHAVARDDKVYVTKDPSIPPSRWFPYHVSWVGKDVYTLSSLGPGWWLHPEYVGEPKGQVRLEPIVSTPSIPPNIPSGYLYDLTRLD